MPMHQSILGGALARAGRNEDARRVLEDLVAQRERDHVSPFAVAAVQLWLGELDEAIDRSGGGLR